MNFVSGFAIYFVCWWISLLAVLPFGVRTQEEAGEVVPGTVASAPVQAHMGRKLIIASIVALLPWGIVFAIMEYDILSFDDFTFIPEFSND
jgi:predicted secreted protein